MNHKCKNHNNNNKLKKKLLFRRSRRQADQLVCQCLAELLSNLLNSWMLMMYRSQSHQEKPVELETSHHRHMVVAKLSIALLRRLASLSVLQCLSGGGAAVVLTRSRSDTSSCRTERHRVQRDDCCSPRTGCESLRVLL